MEYYIKPTVKSPDQLTIHCRPNNLQSDVESEDVTDIIMSLATNAKSDIIETAVEITAGCR